MCAFGSPSGPVPRRTASSAPSGSFDEEDRPVARDERVPPFVVADDADQVAERERRRVDERLGPFAISRRPLRPT